ncbi:Uncharacterised protein [Mycobacteroides abscessus subsp. abscessus]|nr:Uncharacterised protein [Mycobacteroides abscessus subsp. abscessus]SKY09813.1 Uncharacterised protein [Mycobacteroides abscessus subsp. abscessus]SKY37392.1 Uncharacterised protein [Mycobacteroides abscessus subsp. abscessus]
MIRLYRSFSAWMSLSACLRVSSVRNTAALLSIDCCSSVRMSATRSSPCSDSTSATHSVTIVAGFSGRSMKSWASAYSAAAMPARRPNTLMSSSELVPSRLAPCTDTQAHSPAAYRPGTTLSLSRSTWPWMLVGIPPIT